MCRTLTLTSHTSINPTFKDKRVCKILSFSVFHRKAFMISCPSCFQNKINIQVRCYLWLHSGNYNAQSDVAKTFECFFLTKSLIQIWRGGQHGNAADFARQQMRHRHVMRRDNECEIFTSCRQMFLLRKNSFVPTQAPEDPPERLDKTLP